MATVSLLRGNWILHRTRAQGLVRRATGEAPAATQHDTLHAFDGEAGSSWRRQQELDAHWMRGAGVISQLPGLRLSQN